MNKRLVHVAILVRDYDEAIDFYTNTLDFEMITDERLSETKRWVVVKPKGQGECSILLAKADGESQEKFIGNQSGGRVFLFIHTDNFERDLQQLLDRRVKIVRGPLEEVFGKVVVFEDLYGNKWDLIEPK